MTLWLAAAGGIFLFLTGLLAGRYYPIVNILWLLYTLGLTGLILMWTGHVLKNLNNLLLKSPDPNLPQKGFPLNIVQFNSVDHNFEKVYRKMEVAEFNIINQKAWQAGENLNLLLSSTTDKLTGVPNRAQLDKQMDKLTGKVKPLSVIMMDIDHFKKVNDTYGHDVGDLVLKQFALTIKKSMRPVDILGRFGGEEFMVICNAEINEAMEIAERLRQAVVADPVKISDSREIPITASFGVAEYEAGDTSKTILKRADNALYQAKENGRNRVCKWQGTIFHME